MAFYKALENIELKKYSEATPETFAVVFYSKASLKNSSLFDKDMKQKFQHILKMRKELQCFCLKSSLAMKGYFNHKRF